ncbi:MAG: GLUG motif-containing protein [Phycisphaerales bacterium]
MRGYCLPIIAAFVALSLSARPGGAVEFAGGTGEPNDPYQIATAAQLRIAASARRLSDGRGGGTAPDTGLTSRHFALVADIDLDPCLPGGQVFYEPLLALTSGSLDGRGHKILNLHIGGWGSGPGVNLGRDAVVRDIVFERVVVDGDGSVLTYTNEGCVANCSVEGAACGMGLVAENRGFVMGCSVTAEPGGTCGLAVKNSGSIFFSYVSGGRATDGGLVRENSGIVSDCYSTATVFGKSVEGGLVGTNSGEISRCYATGNVTASGTADSHECLAGGLVGKNSGMISNCYALGRVSAFGSGNGHNYAAGIAAVNSGTVSDCYAAGGGGNPLTGDAYSSGLVLNSYFFFFWDVAETDNGFGIPLTDRQMRQQGSFIGWDFRGSNLDGSGEIWTMPQEGGYPVLAMIQEPAIHGSGTAEDPYLIESADQFLAISRDAGATYRLTSDINLEGRSFALPIIPIFWGRLDGDNHTVANVTFTGARDAGLFGILYSGAEISRLKVAGVHVENAVEGAAGSLGVLAARNHGRIYACSASADCGFRSLGNIDCIGGLVAVNEADGAIRRCLISWAAMGKFDRGGLACWGGIAGHNLGSIAECRASALVGGEIARCAVLVGQNDGVIVNCYADGYSDIAGLVYSNRAEITNCYAAVRVFSGKGKAGLVTENLGGAIVSSYLLAQAAGGGPDNGLGVVLSEVQMRSQASFDGWDFDGVWTICEGRGYPRLRWEGAVCEP